MVTLRCDETMSIVDLAQLSNAIVLTVNAAANHRGWPSRANMETRGKKEQTRASAADCAMNACHWHSDRAAVRDVCWLHGRSVRPHESLAYRATFDFKQDNLRCPPIPNRSGMQE